MHQPFFHSADECGNGHPALGITEACAGAQIMHQTSLVGGLGARCAPNGEREGQSPLASMQWLAVGERDGCPLGVEPARMRDSTPAALG
jgi:hypothetical protein